MSYVRICLYLFTVPIFFFIQLNTVTASQDTIERFDLEILFTDRGLKGTFALLDVSNDRLVLVDAERARARKIPASTFKIPNSLIALETKVISDEDEIVPYGGKPQPVKSWEKDLSMRQANTVSSVPVYQELARRIGLRRYRQWLAKLEYGNQDVGETVEKFWLAGPLMISAEEQVRFLAKLAQQTLPVSKKTQSTVRDIVRLEEIGGRTLYGKTGWTTAPNPQIAWFVGWVENENGIFAFSLNIDVFSKADVDMRLEITKQILRKLQVF